MSRYTAVPAAAGRKYACGFWPTAGGNPPAAACPTVTRARIPADPFSPTPLARTKLPPSSTYSKYCPSRSCSKSSHQIHPGCGTAHWFADGEMARWSARQASDKRALAKREKARRCRGVSMAASVARVVQIQNPSLSRNLSNRREKDGFRIDDSAVVQANRG